MPLRLLDALPLPLGLALLLEADHVSCEIEDYVIHEDWQPGRVEFSRVDEDAPKHIAVTLELVQNSLPKLLRVHRDELVILEDRYRIVGWLPDIGALDCVLAEP